jgi:hypothetical protein
LIGDMTIKLQVEETVEELIKETEGEEMEGEETEEFEEGIEEVSVSVEDGGV